MAAEPEEEEEVVVEAVAPEEAAERPVSGLVVPRLAAEELGQALSVAYLDPATQARCWRPAQEQLI